jgi:hypothetical protein
MATNLAVERRHAMLTTHTFLVLDEFLDEGSVTLAAVIASEPTLSAGVDNYNCS